MEWHWSVISRDLCGWVKITGVLLPAGWEKRVARGPGLGGFMGCSGEAEVQGT